MAIPPPHGTLTRASKPLIAVMHSKHGCLRPLLTYLVGSYVIRYALSERRGKGGTKSKIWPFCGEMCILDFWEFCPKAHPPTPHKAFGDMHHTNTQHECTNLEDLAATDRRLCLSPHLGFAHLRLRHLRQITSHRKSEPK